MSDKCAEVEYYYRLSDPVIALGIIRHTHTHTSQYSRIGWLRPSMAPQMPIISEWLVWCLAHRFPNIVTRMLFILLVCVLLGRFL